MKNLLLKGVGLPRPRRLDATSAGGASPHPYGIPLKDGDPPCGRPLILPSSSSPAQGSVFRPTTTLSHLAPLSRSDTKSAISQAQPFEGQVLVDVLDLRDERGH